MKNIFIIVFIVFLMNQNIAFTSPKISFEQLMIRSEENPELMFNARQEAIKRNQPVNIITLDNVIIDVKSLEDGRPVYLVITDFLNPYNGGYTAFYEEIVSSYNLNRAKIYYGNGITVDNTNGYFNPVLSDNLTPSKYLLVTDWTFDRVYMFSAANGDLLDTAYIPRTSPQLQSPRHALQHPNGMQMLVADQISDLVQRFDTSGTYIGPFAPAGGVNNAILDNIRGIRFKANRNMLVTVGSGASTNKIQEFDTAGNFIGTFIGTGLNSPFYIVYRPNDILVANSSAPNDITRYDLNGNFLSNFHASTSLAFPQQIYPLLNGLILVAGFSTPSGVVILDTAGNYIRTLNAAITGNRGIYLLGNGNYLTTNGAGVHEIDSSSGALIRTVTTGSNFQFISELNNIELTLTINFEACNSQDTIFAELRHAVPPYNLMEYSVGTAGQGTPSVFKFIRARNGEPYYVVIRHRNSITTWSSATQTFSADALSYDFTTSSSQAFGDNMINVAGEWSIYTGDPNQDGIVDGSDGSLIDNDASIFATGYLVTDLNCDGVVDGSDGAYVENNAANFVGVIAP